MNPNMRWMDEELDYCASTYSREQIEPKAKQCEEEGCPSYIRCFFGKPKIGFNGIPLSPFPVCARNILNRMNQDRDNKLSEIESLLQKTKAEYAEWIKLNAPSCYDSFCKTYGVHP